MKCGSCLQLCIHEVYKSHYKNGASFLKRKHNGNNVGNVRTWQVYKHGKFLGNLPCPYVSYLVSSMFPYTFPLTHVKKPPIFCCFGYRHSSPLQDFRYQDPSHFSYRKLGCLVVVISMLSSTSPHFFCNSSAILQSRN